MAKVLRCSVRVPFALVVLLQALLLAVSSPIPSPDGNDTGPSHGETSANRSVVVSDTSTCKTVPENKLIAMLGVQRRAILQRFTPQLLCGVSKASRSDRRRSVRSWNESQKLRSSRALNTTLLQQQSQQGGSSSGSQASERKSAGSFGEVGDGEQGICQSQHTRVTFAGLHSVAENLHCPLTVGCHFDPDRYPSTLYWVSCGSMQELGNEPQYRWVEVLRKHPSRCVRNKKGNLVAFWQPWMEQIPVACTCGLAQGNSFPN